MIMETKVRLAIVECGQALGVQQLMSKQLEALDAFLNGRDTFVLSHWVQKSVSYAVLPLVFDFLKGILQSSRNC